MNVSFTGHREVDKKHLRVSMYEFLETLISKGADIFFAGGASGFDTIAAQTVLELKSMYPWISLVLVLPCSPEEQTRSFSRDMQKLYFDIKQNADKVELISPHYTETCMKQRNQRLIDYADICVCYYDERRPYTGTGQTVRMAYKKGINVINLYKE